MNWTLFWTATLILTNLISTFYVGYLRGKLDQRLKSRADLFFDICEFERKQCKTLEEAKVVNALADYLFERTKPKKGLIKNDKSNS